MAKVTSKLQVTLPKRIAEKHGIVPGDQIRFESMGDSIRIVPEKLRAKGELSTQERLRLFDEATRRLAKRGAKLSLSHEPPAERDWRREDLYTRGESD